MVKIVRVRSKQNLKNVSVFVQLRKINSFLDAVCRIKITKISSKVLRVQPVKIVWARLYTPTFLQIEVIVGYRVSTILNGNYRMMRV